MGGNTYTIEKSESGFVGGRYNSKTPSGAAKKAATRLFRSTNKKSLKFTIRQTTQGSDKKLYKYEAKRIKLNKPVIVTIKGKEIKYEYKTVVTPIKESKSYIMKGGADVCDGNTCAF